MTTTAFLPAAKVRRWALGLAGSLAASVFPLMVLHAQQSAALPAQSAQNPPSQQQSPAQPPAAGQQPASGQQGQPSNQSDQSDDSSGPTIRLGVNVGPDGNKRRSVCPVARILTEVPPTSTASTFLAEEVFAARALFRRPVRRLAECRDFAFTALARSLERGRFGVDHDNAQTSIPAAANRASSSSELSLSVGIACPTSPCSASAYRVHGSPRMCSAEI